MLITIDPSKHLVVEATVAADQMTFAQALPQFQRQMLQPRWSWIIELLEQARLMLQERLQEQQRSCHKNKLIDMQIS